MFRVILPDEELECDDYERDDHGVLLLDTFDDQIGFVPYDNLHAIVENM